MDNLGLLALGVAAIAVLNYRATNEVRPVGSPSAQLEVDPTRWRHTGEQPLSVKMGNGESILDERFALFARGLA